jgi:hypothetical protein
MLIDGVQRAEQYNHLMESLNCALEEVGERLQVYQWKYSAVKKDALMPISDLSKVTCFISVRVREH